MIDPNKVYDNQSDDALLAQCIGSKGTRSQHRHKGTGPAYLKIGKHIKYEGKAILAYYDQCRITPINQQ